jgi:uncharacterized protein
MARRRRTTAVVIVCVVALATTLAGCSTRGKSADRPTLTVHGTSTIDAVPDLLTVVMGVQTMAAAAAAALADNNTKSQRLLAQLRTSGVADRDLQTSQLSVNPTYDPKGKINGYQVTNLVTAKLRQLDKAGGLIDSAAAAVGDAVRIQSLAFSVDQTSATFEKARAAAVKDATTRAKTIAKAAGVRLGRIRTITDDTQPAPPPLTFGVGAAASTGTGAAAPAIAIAPGTQQVTSNVTVIYELK